MAYYIRVPNDAFAADFEKGAEENWVAFLSGLGGRARLLRLKRSVRKIIQYVERDNNLMKGVML